jgi:hypothetical protein
MTILIFFIIIRKTFRLMIFKKKGIKIYITKKGNKIVEGKKLAKR